MKFFLASLACIFASGLAHASENWPRFRGPNGGGGSESSIPAVWEKSSYRWQLPLKENGHGSPVVWGNRVFLNSSADKGQTRKVLCIDAEKGKVNWTRSYPSKTHKTHRYNSFASSTPALDDKNVYSVWGHSTELKVSAHTHEGKLLWEKDLGGVKGGHGFAVSPIVFEDLLIVPNDQEKGGGSALWLGLLDGRNPLESPERQQAAYLFHAMRLHGSQRKAGIDLHELVARLYQFGTSDGQAIVGTLGFRASPFRKGDLLPHRGR